MPLDKRKLDLLLEEIKHLEEESLRVKRLKIHHTPKKITTTTPSTKKDYLLNTEKKAYFQINHYYKLVMLSVEDTATAFELWLKGILPLLLSRHGLDREEWDRICNLGDSDKKLEKELIDDWKIFFRSTIQKGLIDKEIMVLINEGRQRVKKMKGNYVNPASNK